MVMLCTDIKLAKIILIKSWLVNVHCLTKRDVSKDRIASSKIFLWMSPLHLKRVTGWLVGKQAPPALQYLRWYEQLIHEQWQHESEEG